jgi:hypothetical protein
MSHGHYSSFLFARPSFIEGCARVIDVGGTLQQYNTSPDGSTADYFAMYADWLAVGADLQNAIDSLAPGTNRVKEIAKRKK